MARTPVTAVLLIAVVATLAPLAQASPSDPLWIGGVFDANDQDIIIRGRNFKPNCEVLWNASNTVYRLVQKNQTAGNPDCIEEEGEIVLCGGLVRFSESELRLTMIVPSGVGPGEGETTTMFVINDPGVLTDEAISNSINYSFSNVQDPNDCIPPGPAPNITSIQPDLGPIDNGAIPPADPACTITIRGSGFVDGATVFFGANPAPSVQFINSTTLFVTTPLSPAAGPTSTSRRTSFPHA